MSRAVRLSWPDVQPLQLWDLPLGDGRCFWQAVSARRVEDLREEGWHEGAIGARIAAGVVAGCRALPHRFKGVHLFGGLALLSGLRETLTTLRTPWPFYVSSGSPRDYALYAKRYLFGSEPMIVVDVGQTTIKGYLPDGTRFLFVRDTTLIPYGACPDKADRAVQFVKSAIASLRSVVPTAAVLMALPAPVDQHLVPGESTYGIDGRDTFVDEVIDDPSCPVFVMNDAELAAECARGEGGAAGGPRLVLSLGLGPGGALLAQGG